MNESLCPECYQKWDAWNDYPLTPGPIQLITISGGVRGVLDRRKARYEEWRATIRFQQQLIKQLCEANHANYLTEVL